MAKPCRYQLPGEDTWMSESEFKKALNDGLIDKYVSDGTIAIRNFKPKAQAAPVVEAPVEPVVEKKSKSELEKEFNTLNKQYVADDKLLTEATKNNQDTTDIESRMNDTQQKMSEISNQIESPTEITAPVAETKTEAPVAKASGYSPNDNLFNKPELAKNKTHGWRTMNEKEFNSLSSGEKTYEGGAPKSGNWIAGVPESAAKFGKKGVMMVEFGGINIEGGENMSKGSTANKSNVTKVWRYNNETKKFEEAPDLLDKVKKSEKIEESNSKTKTADQLRGEADDIFDKQIPEIKGFSPEFYSVVDVRNSDVYGSYKNSKEKLKKDGINLDDLLSESDKSKLNQIEVLQEKAEKLYDKADAIEAKKEPVKTKKAPTQPKVETKAEPAQAKETETEYQKEEPTEQPKTQEDYIKAAKESNGDYAIVEGRTGNQVVYKKNRRTGRWQGLTGKGEFVDVNDEMNRKANDAVNYTRKDKKVVMMSTVKNGITSTDEFVYDYNTNEWKKRSEDGYLYGIGPELAAKAEQRFLVENPKRAPKTKEEVKQRISDAIDGLKADEGIAMSSLIPIPPKYWNKILDLVKEAMFKGVDFSFAVNDAARKVFNEAIKNKEITRSEADEYIRNINDDKNESIPELTSIKKAFTSDFAQQVAEKGIDRMSYSEAFKIAEEAINSGKINPDNLVDQVIDNPRPLDAIETAVFTYSKTKLSNDLKELYDKLDSSSNPSAETEINQQIKLLTDKMLKYDIASNIVGYIQGLSLSIRRVMLNADYDLVLPQIKKLYSDAGKEMPEGLEQKIKDAQKEFRRLNREIEKLRNEAQKAKEEDAVESIAESTKRPSRKSKGTPRMSMSSDGKIAVSNESIRNAVLNGAKEIEDVVEAVRDEVKSKFPDATDRQIRDAISNYGKEINKTKDEITEEIERIRRIGKILSKLEDVQNQIKNKTSKIKNPEIKTKAIKILSLRESELKRALKQAMSEIPVTEQEMKDFQKYKLEAYKKSMSDRIAELKRRINEGDFSTKKRTRAFELDAEAKKLEAERQAIIEDFEYAKTKAEMEVEPLLKKLNRSILSAFNLPKGLIASIDVSAPFRQGIIFMMTQNPVKSAQQLKQMFGFWGNTKNYDKWLAELKASDEYALIKASGVYISEQNGKLSAMEEVFANNLGNKIPLLGQSYKIKGAKLPGLDLYKRSEAAYSGFLNNLRVQSFMDGAQLLKENGYTIQNNPEVFKDWANYVNSATGRGNMNPELAVKLGPIFFSPRLIKARLEQIGVSDALALFGLSDGFYMKMSPPARAMALKRMGAFMGVMGTIIGLAALYYNNDDDDKSSVELDPRSSDFGKLKFGNTRVDLTGGFATYYRAFGQFLSGKRKDINTGEIQKLNQGFGKKTRFEVLQDFYGNKLSPFAQKVYQYTAVSDEERERRALEEASQETAFNKSGMPLWLQDLTIPLWMRDVEPIMKDQGNGTGLFLIGLSLLGEGIQYYEAKGGSSSQGNQSFEFNNQFQEFENIDSEFETSDPFKN